MASFSSLFGNLFGFSLDDPNKKINSTPKIEDEANKSFAIPQKDDGAVTIQSGSYYGTYVDLDGNARNEIELITRYREMSLQPELETAIQDIVGEAIVRDDTGKVFKLNMENMDQSDTLKKKINDELANILRLLNFNKLGQDIFQRWYVDGRIFYHIIIDDKNPSKGIQELRLIDPRRIRKIREIQKTKDPTTGMEIIKTISEYYLYNERGITGNFAQGTQGQRITPDCIVNVNSGLLDSKQQMVLSYLHKAIKPLNQLRMIEDATVIYRLSRAPERRIFYVDVGNMPTIKAEQYLRDIMVKYRNKLVYDANTGEVKDDRKFLSMLEDFWLPRREGSKGTEITTLPGGENLGKIEDVEYFEKKLYKALGIPYSRTQPSTGFSLGRSQEITRDEVKFAKFIDKLRNRFSGLFDELLKTQLVLKKICTEEEWEELQETIWYEYLKDNNYEELKEAEINQTRVGLLQIWDPYVGQYVSKDYIYKKVLRFNDEEISEMKKQIKKESKENSGTTPSDAFGNPLPVDPQTGQPIPPQDSPDYGARMNPPLETIDQEPGKKVEGVDRYTLPDSDIIQEKTVADRATDLGLDYYGFGRYGFQGRSVYKSVNNQLVPIV